MPSWNSTWSRMKSLVSAADRDWMPWGEFDGLLRMCGVTLSHYHVRQALRTAPPEKRYGLKRYERRHLQLVVQYAIAKGLARRDA